MSQKRKPSPQKHLLRVSIRAEHKTEPDWDRFAWALLQYIRLKQTGVTTKSTPLHPPPGDDIIVNLTTPHGKETRLGDNHNQ
jgi:hypothetical protein